MKTKLLYTAGDGKFVETDWEVPALLPNQIMVKAVMTGVCRSDIDMMTGGFGPLPIHMSGHEGLGQVMEVGSDVANISVGDYVATRGEPAYANCYPCNDGEFVQVPVAHARYILEPVACGINLINQPMREIIERSGPGKRLLIIGSGFLAWVAYHTIMLNHLEFDITVHGRSNVAMWGDKLSNVINGEFDVIIDLNSGTQVFNDEIVKPNALVVLGAQKTVTTDFSSLLWKACTMIFPSPRTAGFLQCMKDAEKWITNGDIQVDSFWTTCYNRTTQWQDAFADGAARPPGYSRGYIKWD
jgi:D-arabinose 1-dehydrogenase-like Zn-dependent alcohol dehydrogenase